MNKKPNVTYLLGAGASYHAVPTYESFGDHLEIILKHVTRRYKIGSTTGRITEIENKQNQIRSHFSQFKELLPTVLNHSTADTYAKKLYLQEEYEELNKVKSLISSFIALEESEEKHSVINSRLDHEIGSSSRGARSTRDSRYDVFFATLLDKDLQLPKNVKVLSWNYDGQMELAYMDYMKKEKADFGLAMRMLNVYPTYLKPSDYIEEVEDQIIKLNGSAYGKMTLDKSDTYAKIKEPSSLNVKNIEYPHKESGSLLEWFTDFENSICVKNGDHKVEYLPSITFAWEETPVARKAIAQAQKILSETDILVIIGYSFPNFNRSIDREIMSRLWREASWPIKMKQIIIQCPRDHYNYVKEGFMSCLVGLAAEKAGAIIEPKETNQFYIPTSIL